MNNLPQRCYTTRHDGEVVLIINGQNGYFNGLGLVPDRLEFPAPTSDQMNESLGVSPEAEEAMVGGSMFGWETPLVQDFGKDLESNYDDERQTILNDPS
jgi:hypothetical protein